MMISPEYYIEQFKDKSYEECLKERDKLIRNIRRFEKGNITEEELMIRPSPDVRYQCELWYLAKLCDLIVDKYQEMMNDDDE